MNFAIPQLPTQKGKVAIVTGANSGLGFETSLALAKKEATIIMACRDLKKAESAKNKILTEVPAANLKTMEIDLSKLESVRSFAQSYIKEFNQLDLLINNAGVMMPPYEKTEDGLELQFEANYLGHFLLTALLIDSLLKTPNSRVVSLSSIAHKSAKINFNDLQSEKSYSKSMAYGQSKLACLIFAYELQRRLEKRNTTTISVAAHPGVSNTDLARHLPKFFTYLIGPLLLPLITHEPPKAAKPQINAAINEEITGGDYLGPTGFYEMKGEVGKVDSTAISKDCEIAKRLWDVSEKLCDVTLLSNQ